MSNIVHWDAINAKTGVSANSVANKLAPSQILMSNIVHLDAINAKDWCISKQCSLLQF